MATTTDFSKWADGDLRPARPTFTDGAFTTWADGDIRPVVGAGDYGDGPTTGTPGGRRRRCSIAVM